MRDLVLNAIFPDMLNSSTRIHLTIKNVLNANYSLSAKVVVVKLVTSDIKFVQM